MASLISKIKDAWLVLTGKGIISREYAKPLVMHGRLSKYRTVTVSTFGPTPILNPGEIPLRMTSFETVGLGKIDTRIVTEANFMAPLIGDRTSRRMLLTIEGVTIEGIFLGDNPCALSISCKEEPVFTAEVLVELPEYQLIRSE